jgi:hypothetical protein
MNVLDSSLVLVCFALSSAAFTAGASSPAGSKTPPSPRAVLEPQGGDKLVYADFETVKDNRPVSSRGGSVQLYKYEESPSNMVRFKGVAPGSDAPDLVRLSKTDPNRAIAFEYELRGPNQWAGVGVQVHGLPDSDGKPAAEDVSNYKYLTLQLYVTGVSDATVEFISTGQGVIYQGGGPQMTFKIGKGLNTYKVPLNNVNQPAYVEGKIKAREVLKKLTSINVFVSCGPCSLVTGNVVVDNLIFQN